MKKHYVYQHVRTDTNQPFYIGIGTQYGGSTLYKRAHDFKRRNDLWKGLINLFEFKVEILFESDSYTEVKEKECEFIALYGRIDNKTGILSNLTDGGEGCVNYIVSMETRQKFRNRLLGSKHPSSTITNMSLGQKRRYEKSVVSPKCIEIFQYSIKGEYLRSWTSVTHAARSLGCRPSDIFKAFGKKNHYSKSFLWFKEYQGERATVSNDIVYHSKIAMLDMKGNILKVYKTISAAVKENFNNSTGKNIVSDICKGNLQSFNNLKYKYHD